MVRPSPSGHVLIVDDEKLIRWTLAEFLGREGYEVETAETGAQALRLLEEKDFDIAVFDFKLPDLTGVELLEKAQARAPGLPVVMVTAHSSIENAVAAMRAGAVDYIGKPFQNEDILLRLAKALETTRLRREVERYQEENLQRYSFERLIGCSEEMQRVRKLLERLVQTGDTTVLISGESGTGKDVIAKAIHYASPRSSAVYVNITCTAIPETLLESILFGHEKGAFTDAKALKRGLIEDAHGGTVFLDEIGDMTLYLQGKILRFLEEKTIRRVGGNRDIKVDVRVIAATNKDLKKLVQEGRFREDLYFRVKVIPVQVPPLRERKADIPLLVEHFIREYNREFKKNVQGLSPKLLKRFEEYHWPGNVRELKNTIERAMILGTGERLDAENLPLDLFDEPESSPAADGAVLQLTRKGIQLEKLEESLIHQALRLARGNQTRAGALLGLNRDQIRYRIEKFAIDLSQYTDAD